MTRLFATGVVLLGLIVGAVGCRTTSKPAGGEAAAGAIASIQLRGNTPGQIREVATEVFEEHGYIRGSRRPSEMVFEKPGSKLSNIVYGSWIGDTPVWIRVKLFLAPAGEQEYTLECKAYHVQDKGSATEEELKIGRLGSGAYRKLLDEIAARFQKHPYEFQP